jgi:hypothetical protein
MRGLVSSAEPNGGERPNAGSHLTNLEEHATRVGMLWLKPNAKTNRQRRRVLLFKQVGLACRGTIPRGTCVRASAPCSWRWALLSSLVGEVLLPGAPLSPCMPGRFSFTAARMSSPIKGPDPHGARFQRRAAEGTCISDAASRSSHRRTTC